MTPRTIRLPFEYNLNPSDNETLIEAVKGNPLNIQFGIFQDNIPYDLDALTSVSFVVRPARGTATNLASDTIASAAMTPLPTRSRWDRGTMQHGTFAFTDAEMNLTVTSPYTDYWWSAYALPTSAEEITLGMGVFRLYESNIANGGVPPVNPGATITAAEADARYLAVDVDGDLNKCGTYDLGDQVVGGTVTFATAFSGTPRRVFSQVEIPATGGNPDATANYIWSNVHSRSATGFKFVLAGPTGDANHKLHWEARL